MFIYYALTITLINTKLFGMDTVTEEGRDIGKKLTPYEKTVMRDWRVVHTGPAGNIAEVPVEELVVTDVDLKVKENTEAHNTFDYDIVDDVKNPQLVVRRGQAFDITITCTRPYDITKDDLRIILEFGDKAVPSKGSYIVLKPWDKDPPQNEWKTFPEPIDGNRLHIAVLPPADCPVAKWKLKIDVMKTSEKTLYRFFNEERFVYILFNAWCKDDLVYMEKGYMSDVDLDRRKEYVMNEKGAIYRGSYWHISPLGWNFGQFDGIVLDCVMYLLDNVSVMKDSARGDPVRVSRAIASVVNSSDNYGVLTGRWSKPYTGGEVPWKWNGSVKILEQYFETKSPVKYAQCWVFSGVVTTVCRALGIPARSVTNFASAHDTDESMTIDTHYDGAGEEIGRLNDDSVWNYHVWNEAWMGRPDLPSGYGGWQAIDATPQERSNSMYRMGPMSVQAVKEGNVSLMYDGPFLFAEVNADKITWSPDERGNMKPFKIDKYSIGKNISTKLPLGTTRRASKDREDVTNEYKFKDGSVDERKAIEKANMHSKRKNIYTDKEWDTEFKVDINSDTRFGETFKVSLTIKNNSDIDKNILGSTIVKSTDYRGKPHKTILSRALWGENARLKPREEKLITYDAPFDLYYKMLADDQCFIKTTCFYKVEETHQLFSNVEELELVKPSLSIEGPEKGIANQKFTVKATFKNPLPIPLTKCGVTVDSHGIRQVTDTSLELADVAVDGLFEYSCELIPQKSGTRDILMTFNSEEMHSVDGSHEIEIAKGDSRGSGNPPVGGTSGMEVTSAGDSSEMEVTTF